MLAELCSVAVGLGEIKISRNPADVLVAYGLGSCMGVGMYDPEARVGGLLHAVLPVRNGTGDVLAAKYVDTGLAQLLDELTQAGAERRRLIVRMAGGANMLGMSDPARLFNIGQRNIVAAHEFLTAHRLRAQAQTVGGTAGRTMRVYVANGRMTVRSMGHHEQDI